MNYYNVLTLVNQDGLLLKEYRFFQDNYDIVMTAVKQSGWDLEYASMELKNNYDIVYFAVKQNKRNIQFASKEIRNIIYNYGGNDLIILKWFYESSKIPTYTKSSQYFDRTDLVNFNFV